MSEKGFDKINSSVESRENKEEKQEGKNESAPHEPQQDKLDNWEGEKFEEQENYLKKRLKEAQESVDFHLDRAGDGDEAKLNTDKNINITIQQCTEEIDSLIKERGGVGAFAGELSGLKKKFIGEMEQIRGAAYEKIDKKKQEEIKKKIASS